MMGSRKFFVLSMALALALVGSGTALGQQFCTVSAPNGGLEVRASGLTELVDDIHMICLAGQVAAKTNYKVTVDLGAAKITNTILADKTTEANDITLRMTSTVEAFGATDTALDAATALAPGPGLFENFARDITGKLVRNNSAVEFVFNTVAVEAAPERFALEIKGIRVNAAAVGAGNTITATVSAVGASIFDDNAIVARPTAGLVTKAIGVFNASGSGPVQGLACAASSNLKDLHTEAGADSDNDGITDNHSTQVFDIEVKEGFEAAFEQDNGKAQRIRLSFDDIPDGVKVYLRPSPSCVAANGGNGALATAANTATAPNRLKLILLSGTGSDGAGTGSTAVVPPNGQGYVQVSLSGGSGAMVYQIGNSTPSPASAATTPADDTEENGGASRVENCDIPIAFVWTGSVELGSGTVSVGFAPLSSAAAAHVDATIPRFMGGSGSAIEAITVGECATTLLFPFVTNQAGYETGIAISNTSQDTFGTTESAGSCEVFFHGSMMGGGAAPSSETSGSIAAGEQWVFGLSQKAAGFQGYLMVDCDFQFAHGLAFITNGFAGVPTLAQSYLALVVPLQHGRRTVPAGGHEMLNN